MDSLDPNLQTQNRPNFLDRGLYLVGATIAVFAWGGMVARVLSDTHPIWDLASHMSWHFWVATTSVLVLSSLGVRFLRGERRTRWWHRLVMVLPPWLYFTWVTSPWASLPLAANEPNAAGLRILSWNIWVLNKSPEEVLAIVRESDADVVAIIELGHEQAVALKQLEREYPYCSWQPGYAASGIAVLSRVPGTEFRSLMLGQRMPAIETLLPGNDIHGEYRMLAVHTTSPDLHQRTLDRNRQLVDIVDWSAHTPESKIVVGDLNITPWSPPFARMLKQARLVDSRQYRGNYASWPTDLGILGIPIDHALVSQGTEVLFRDVGLKAPDSDHRPITVIVK